MPLLFKLHLHHILLRPLANGIKQLSAISDEITKWRISQGEQLAGKDLFSALLEAKDPETGQGFTQAELVSEAGLLIVGGTDTTITGITATIFYLVTNPSVLTHLEHEIRTEFSDIEDIRIGPQLERCCYLSSCITESLRLTPPVGSILPREVLPGGLTVDGTWFPPGTDLGVPHYALHHSEEHFPAPFEFRPERWLAKASVGGEQFSSNMEKAQTQTHAAFTAFGLGRTSCIGKHLAYQEMSLVLARIVWLYEMRLAPSPGGGKGAGPAAKQFPTLDRFVSSHDGPMVQFRLKKM